MEKNSTTDATPLFSGEAWFDPIEAELRERVRGFLEEMIEQEATAALGRSRYQRGVGRGYRIAARVARRRRKTAWTGKPCVTGCIDTMPRESTA